MKNLFLCPYISGLLQPILPRSYRHTILSNRYRLKRCFLPAQLMDLLIEVPHIYPAHWHSALCFRARLLLPSASAGRTVRLCSFWCQLVLVLWLICQSESLLLPCNKSEQFIITTKYISANFLYQSPYCLHLLAILFIDNNTIDTSEKFHLNQKNSVTL